MRNDLIKRFDAIEALGEEPYVWTDDDEFAQGERSQWIDDISAIRAVPPANIPQGEWIDKGWKGDWQFETDGRGNCWHEYECSECGFHNKGSKNNYCPNCGAKMKG